MRKVIIQNWDQVQIPGVRFAAKAEQRRVIRENYFECTAMPLKTPMAADGVVCGILEGWHHTPVFNTWETHRDAETFYYFQGTALMPFIELKDGIPDPNSVKIVRIPAGVQVEVLAGVAHFVAVAENDRFSCLVYSPDQGGDRFYTQKSFEGVPG